MDRSCHIHSSYCCISFQLHTPTIHYHINFVCKASSLWYIFLLTHLLRLILPQTLCVKLDHIHDLFSHCGISLYLHISYSCPTTYSLINFCVKLDHIYLPPPYLWYVFLLHSYPKTHYPIIFVCQAFIIILILV